jgi:hypothetical protein
MENGKAPRVLDWPRSGLSNQRRESDSARNTKSDQQSSDSVPACGDTLRRSQSARGAGDYAESFSKYSISVLMARLFDRATRRAKRAFDTGRASARLKLSGECRTQNATSLRASDAQSWSTARCQYPSKRIALLKGPYGACTCANPNCGILLETGETTRSPVPLTFADRIFTLLRKRRSFNSSSALSLTRHFWQPYVPTPAKFRNC